MEAKEYNSKVRAEGQQIQRKLKYRIRTMTSKGKGDLVKTVRMKSRTLYNEVSALWWTFDVHGAFVYHGVGKGYKKSGGKVMRTAKGKVIKKREPVDFINPALDASIEKIADISMEYMGDKSLEQTSKVIGVKR